MATADTYYPIGGTLGEENRNPNQASGCTLFTHWPLPVWQGSQKGW